MKDFNLTIEQINICINSKFGTLFNGGTFTYKFKGWEYPALVFEIFPSESKQNKFEYKFFPKNLKESEK